MSEPMGGAPLDADDWQPEDRGVSAADTGGLDETNLEEGGLDTGIEDLEARDYAEPASFEAQDAQGPDVPSTTDDRLAERLDPNRHHAGEPEGIATALQPGGLIPGGGPAAGLQGALGTGGAQTGGDDTGDVASGGV